MWLFLGLMKKLPGSLYSLPSIELLIVVVISILLHVGLQECAGLFVFVWINSSEAFSLKWVVEIVKFWIDLWCDSILFEIWFSSLFRLSPFSDGFIHDFH